MGRQAEKQLKSELTQPYANKQYVQKMNKRSEVRNQNTIKKNQQVAEQMPKPKAKPFKSP